MTIVTLFLTYLKIIELLIRFVKINDDFGDFFEHVFESRQSEYVFHQELKFVTIAKHSEDVFEFLLNVE